MAQKYFFVDGVATLIYHRGVTTLPGHPPDLSAGPAILCLHGAGGNGNEFSGVLDALAGRFSPISYDQPGHGRSGSLDSLGSVEAMAAHVRGLARALGLERPVLVGDGLGASVALQALLDDPGFARGLVLTGASAVSDVGGEVISRLQRIVAGKDRRLFDSSGYAPETSREVYQRAFAEWVKTDPRVTLGDRRAEQAWDGRERLKAVTAPVVVAVGEFEAEGSEAAARALAAELADARIAEVSGAGGHAVLERPEQLAGLIADLANEAVR